MLGSAKVAEARRVSHPWQMAASWSRQMSDVHTGMPKAGSNHQNRPSEMSHLLLKLHCVDAYMLTK